MQRKRRRAVPNKRKGVTSAIEETNLVLEDHQLQPAHSDDPTQDLEDFIQNLLENGENETYMTEEKKRRAKYIGWGKQKKKKKKEKEE